MVSYRVFFTDGDYSNLLGSFPTIYFAQKFVEFLVADGLVGRKYLVIEKTLV